jgi:hypothetical protein
MATSTSHYHGDLPCDGGISSYNRRNPFDLTEKVGKSQGKTLNRVNCDSIDVID